MFERKIIVSSVITLGLLAPLSANSATYQVQDLGTLEDVPNSYGMRQSDSGTLVVQGKKTYAPIDAGPEDGDVDLEDDLCEGIVDELERDLCEQENEEDDPVTTLPEGNNVAMLFDPAGNTRINVFDQIDPETGELTESTEDFVWGINNADILVGSGSAPYRVVQHTDNEGNELSFFVRDWNSRAYVITGGVSAVLLPPFAESGGVSIATAISDSNTVIGYVSTDYTESSRRWIEESCPAIDQPAEVCAARNLNFQLRAYEWQIDPVTGAVISERELGLLAQPNEDDERQFLSQALAINASGVSVGRSYAFLDATEDDRGDENQIRDYAALFRDGEVINLNVDEEEFRRSLAYDINDQGIVVGYTTFWITNGYKNKFFYLDSNTEELVMQAAYGDNSQVEDFFETSNSRAISINNLNQVVGIGEYELRPSGIPRRSHGFLYDIDSNTFNDLNTFLPCDSEHDIVEANHIDDDGNIMAVSLLTVDLVDDDGEPVLDEDGNNVKTQVARAVRLTPIPGGEIEQCEEREEPKNTREGAAAGWLSLFGLVVLVFLRSRRVFRNFLQL